MSKEALAHLVVVARKLNPEFHAQIVGPWTDAEPWRTGVPASIKKNWEKLEYSERLVIFVLLLGGDPDDELATPWRFAVGDRVRFTTDVVVTVCHIMPGDSNSSLSIDDVPIGTEGEVIQVENPQLMCSVSGLAGPNTTTIVYLRDDHCLERA